MNSKYFVLRKGIHFLLNPVFHIAKCRSSNNTILSVKLQNRSRNLRVILELIRILNWSLPHSVFYLLSSPLLHDTFILTDSLFTGPMRPTSCHPSYQTKGFVLRKHRPRSGRSIFDIYFSTFILLKANFIP